MSAAERHGIALKQAAIHDGVSVSIDEVRKLFESGQPEERRHLLIALYYAAKADPEIPEAAVDRLRETMHEQTGHIDTSHVPTLMGILEGLSDDEEADATERR